MLARWQVDQAQVEVCRQRNAAKIIHRPVHPDLLVATAAANKYRQATGRRGCDDVARRLLGSQQSRQVRVVWQQARVQRWVHECQGTQWAESTAQNGSG